MTTDSEYSNTNPRQYVDWWLDAVHQSMLYHNEHLKSKLDYRNINIYNIPPVMQDSERQQINDVANLYIDWIQYSYELALNQLSIASEWSERLTHVVQKSAGVKTIDN